MVYWTVQEGETICNLSASNHSSWMSTLLMNILPNHASTCSYIYEWNGIRYGVPFNRQCLLDTLFNTVWRQFYNFLLETHLPNLWAHLCDGCLILYMCHTLCDLINANRIMRSIVRNTLKQSCTITVISYIRWYKKVMYKKVMYKKVMYKKVMYTKAIAV